MCKMSCVQSQYYNLSFLTLQYKTNDIFRLTLTTHCKKVKLRYISFFFFFFEGGGDEHDQSGIILNTQKSQGKDHVVENPTRVGVRKTPLAPLGAKRQPSKGARRDQNFRGRRSGTTRVQEKPRQVINRRTSGIRTIGGKTYGLVKRRGRRN